MSGVSPTFLLLLVAAYFLGSIPFGLLLARLFGGQDVRQAGSGNIGAANVARVAGLLPGILTLLLDAAKGAFAVWLAGHFTSHSATTMMLAGIAALLGHCYSLWLEFKGGKGVATALGVFGALCGVAALSAFVVFLLILGVWRYVSLSSILAAAAMPVLIYFLWAPHQSPPLTVMFGTLFASSLVIFKHRANLRRLIAGTEPKFPAGKSKGESA